MKIINNEKYISDYRVPSGCAVFGIMDENGSLFSGRHVIEAIAMMHDRSNGLGGGFAAYGIYPEYSDYWAFHLFHDDSICKSESEDMIKKSFNIAYSEKIPTKNNIANAPMIYRYF
jgi:glutamate synthase domain-containing protein 1